MTAKWGNGSEVVSFSHPNDPEPSWRAVFRGSLQAPDFNSRGAAAAFLDGLESGYRKPEPIQ